jgi:hypothetical protein
MYSPRDVFRLSGQIVDEDGMVLVPSMEALKMGAPCGEHVQMEPGRTLWLFDTLDSSRRSAIRYFVDDVTLSGFSLDRVNDDLLFEMVRSAILSGRLVGMRKDPNASKQAPSATVQQQLLVRKIETSSRGRLNFAGRQYKLVVDVDLPGMPNRNSYEVASRDEARRVLDGVAKESGTPGDLATLLAEASAKLTPDWRPSFDPDGIILMRRIIERVAPRRNDEPAITPSQMRALKESWITVEVVDDFGLPWQGKIHLVLQDGGSRDVATDDEGVVHLTNIASGTAATSIAALDAKTWEKT